MDKIKTKNKIILNEIIKIFSFSNIQYSEKILLLNSLNVKQLNSVSSKNRLVLENLKKYLGTNLHAFLVSILYFNAAFLINLKIEKA